ncbi:MAG: YihY/virulence factor BrkB family protein [Armatimonadetes bacterium]|nr:YihY/virulence factor BrkB family protein [Armatimonadota bacterium]
MKRLAAARPAALRHWSFVREIGISAWRDEITILAAAIAHFGLLSLVPATLLTASLLGVLLRGAEAQAWAARMLSTAIPRPEVIASITQRMVADRGQIGGFGLVILLWLSSRTFVVLQRALDSILHIQPHERRRSVLLQGLISVAVMVALGAFAYLSLIASSLVSSLLTSRAGWLPGGERYLSRWVTLASASTTTLLSILLMYLVYRWLPSASVPRRSALAGAVASGLLWEAGKVGFGVYLTRYAAIDRFYGAMGGLALVVGWSYLTALIVLLGAEVTEAHTKVYPAGRPAVAQPDSPDLLDRPADAVQPVNAEDCPQA